MDLSLSVGLVCGFHGSMVTGILGPWPDHNFNYYQCHVIRCPVGAGCQGKFERRKIIAGKTCTYLMADLLKNTYGMCRFDHGFHDYEVPTWCVRPNTCKGPVTHYRCTSPGLNRSTQLTTARKSVELRRESTWTIGRSNTDVVPAFPLWYRCDTVTQLSYRCKSRCATEYHFSVTLVLPMRRRCYTEVPPLFYRCATVDRSYSGVIPLLYRH